MVKFFPPEYSRRTSHMPRYRPTPPSLSVHTCVLCRSWYKRQMPPVSILAHGTEAALLLSDTAWWVNWVFSGSGYSHAPHRIEEWMLVRWLGVDLYQTSPTCQCHPDRDVSPFSDAVTSVMVLFLLAFEFRVTLLKL